MMSWAPTMTSRISASVAASETAGSQRDGCQGAPHPVAKVTAHSQCDSRQLARQPAASTIAGSQRDRRQPVQQLAASATAGSQRDCRQPERLPAGSAPTANFSWCQERFRRLADRSGYGWHAWAGFAVLSRPRGRRPLASMGALALALRVAW